MEEMLFVKILKGRYKVFIGTPLGILDIPQKELAILLMLNYDESRNCICVPNIRQKYRLASKLGISFAREA